MIVFDSSTLILLAKIELIDAFIDDYKKVVIIPQEVNEECCSKKDSFDALLIRKRIEEKKIKTARIHNNELCERFIKDFSIERGEAGALVLFLEKKTLLLAVDDKNAIKACKILKIPFASALTILVRLVARGAIENDDARKKIDMLAKYGRYKDTMIQEARERLYL
jgi:predicted nucleic acid-binding protein